MPKESIQWGGIAKYESANGLIDVEQPSLLVKWFHDPADVQVQIDVSPEYLAQLAGDGGVTVSSGILTRGEINHMIKTLRRARDAAYGADE